MFPYLFDLFGWRVPTYGVLVVSAFLAGLAVTGKLARRAGANPDTILDLGVWSAIAGIVGAKLMMVLVDLGDYTSGRRRLFSIETIQAAGIFYGGFLTALVVAYLYMRRHRLPVLATLDLFAPGIALAHAIGRLGCLFAGCCWGRECSLPWAVTFTRQEAAALVGVPLHKALHPTQVYEALAVLAIFGFLCLRISKPHRHGAVIGWYLVLYSAVRFGLEYLRDPQQPNPFDGPLTIAQWISLGMIVAVIIPRRRISR